MRRRRGRTMREVRRRRERTIRGRMRRWGEAPSPLGHFEPPARLQQIREALHVKHHVNLVLLLLQL